MFRAISLTFLVIATPLMAGEPQKQKPPGYSSPEEAWDAFRFARHDGRWRDAYRSLTPDYQEIYTQGLIFAAVYLEGYRAVEGPVKKLKAILASHGFDLKALRVNTDDPEAERAARAAYSRLKDKEGLYCEAMNVMGLLPPHPKGEDGKPVVELGSFTKITITGDKAEAEYVKQLDDQYESFSIGGVRQTELHETASFRRINGRWFVGTEGTSPNGLAR